jgi:cell division protein FtsW (lipid II flippase)
VLLVAVAAGLVLLGRAPGAVELGLVGLPPALAGLAWVLGDLAGLDALRAVPVLVVLAAAALGRPRVELEAAAGIAGAVAVAAAVPLAAAEQTSLSLHLTLAGALVGTHAVLHASRRPLAWVGSTLVLLGLWVRLGDLGVTVVEAWTLPAAGLLLLAGLLRLRRDREASTALALTPGLLLATVPSLLHVLATDPVSPRAVLLGLACLVLVLGGSGLRWSAPLLVGAAVGSLLLLAELAPYAAATPQWVVIALAGAVLVTVGTTWERRVVDVQRAAHYVGRLR